MPVSERAVLLAVGLGTMLAPLNSTMIAVALPHMLGDFGVGAGASAWLVTAYLVAMALLQPIAGALGDRFGRRHLMLLGLGWFGLVSLGAAGATTFWLLAACRVQQGIAAAIALPNGTAVARDVLPAERRARGFSFIGALTGIAAAGGPPLGGLLVGTAGWRAMFLANVPIVLASFLLAWRAVPRVPRVPRAQPEAPLDQHSAEASSRTQRRGWLPRLTHRRTFVAACAGVGLSNLAFYVTLLVVPLVLATQPGWTSARIGGVLAVLLAASLCFTPLGGYLADRFGRRLPAVIGLALMTAGLAWVAAVTLIAGGKTGTVISEPLLSASLALTGVGLGIAGSGMHTAAVEAVAQEDAGAAAGLYSTSRYLGSITGSAVLAALVGGTAGQVARLDAVFGMVVVAGLLSALVSVGLHDRP